MRACHVGLLCSVTLAISGCGLLGPNEERVVGRIESGPPHPPPVVIPDVVTAGTRFSVSVLTFGSPCVRAGETEVEVVGRTARVTPFDYRQDGVCPDKPNYLEHEATLVFDTPGPGVVIFVGSNVQLEYTIDVLAMSP